MSGCEQCIRRAWLISSLGGLDYLAVDRERLGATLALSDVELIEALGGRRRNELQERYTTFTTASVTDMSDAIAICRHDCCYPRALSSPSAPHLLHLNSDRESLERSLSASVVAILGSTKPSDYGCETARGLARELTASGVTVISMVRDGIATATQLGALEAGSALAVCGDGLVTAARGRHGTLLKRIAAAGCVISELPHECAGRRWGAAASERIVVELAQVVIMVEASELSHELAGARLASSLGRQLAAVPGRVSSELAAGPHSLLREGASLVRGSEDVFMLLAQASGSDPTRAHRAASPAPLAPMLQMTLERVGAGCDTPEKLMSDAARPVGELLLALSELELLGLLVRGENGRYVRSSTR